MEALAYAHGFQFCLTAMSLKYFYNFQYTLVGSFLSYALGAVVKNSGGSKSRNRGTGQEPFAITQTSY